MKEKDWVIYASVGSHFQHPNEFEKSDIIQLLSVKVVVGRPGSSSNWKVHFLSKFYSIFFVGHMFSDIN